MQALYAAGFNAWGQLQFDPAEHRTNNTKDKPDEPEDIRTFTRVIQNSKISHVRSSLTYTAVATSNGINVAGEVPLDMSYGADDENNLYFSEAVNGRVVGLSTLILKAVLISIYIYGASRLTVGYIVYDRTYSSILQYASVDDFMRARRHHDTSLPNIPSDCFTGFLDIIQIVAYDVGFAALAGNGAVWTWGDPRFPECLGRDIAVTPAEQPGRVTSLDDLPTGPIVKLAAGGHVLAAVTSDHDLYCWGGYPGRKAVLPESVTGEPTPIVISTSRDGNGEEADIVDIGMGDGHMIVLAADGTVFVIGSNANGQLGLGRENNDNETLQTSGDKTPPAWTTVTTLPPGKATSVYAGPRSSFVVITE